tara:strand:- start:290 stop:1162 length:873 start_codon:yes stop_codon:yes gene_type:complete
LNKAKEQQVLSFYNEEEDLLDTMNDFCSHIHKNGKTYTDVQGKFRTFSLANFQSLDSNRRIITCSIDSAYTGENGKVIDSITKNLKCDIYKRDLFSKKFFCCIHVPKKSKYGFLIVEKKENHGVKQVFENSFNEFMRLKGVSNYSLQLKQAPPRYLIRNFLEYGKLKEFRLIDGSFPSEFENLNLSLGKEERIFKQIGSTSTSQEIKKVLVSLFKSLPSIDEKIPFLSEGNFDEISFVLEYGRVSKTFYIKRQEKIRSNVDVTNLIKFEEGEATFESLINVSLELINSAA